jgi:hypothetical protein
MIPNANALVNYVKDFTGSSNDAEIRQCIFLAELSMRNLEIPALRTNPWTTVGTIDQYGFLPIPADMLKPILFFSQGNPGSGGSGVGPWVVYDRIGERDMIAQQLVAQLYLNPVNIPQVYRGNFAEVGQSYEFTPLLGEGAEVNMYYYTTWPQLFAEETGAIIGSGTGTVAYTGSGPWTVTITNCSSTTQFSVGDIITATAGTGNLGTGGSIVVASIVNSTTITAVKTGGTAPSAGSITDIIISNPLVQNNVVLQSWPEGYVYGTLREYYLKRKMAEDAAVWASKFDNAWNTIEDQNSKGKWSGGHTKMWSVFQPRQIRRFSTK